MTNPRLTAALLAALACTTDLAAQGRVWVVDANNRPGTHFTEIQPAITAAAHEDVVVVREAAAYQPATISKGIALVFADRPLIATTNILAPVLRIEQLPAGRVFRMTGIVRTQETGATPTIVLAQCAGTIVLDRCQFEHVLARPRLALQIDQCNAVFLTHCVIGHGMASIASRVELHACDLIGPGDRGPSAPGLPAITVQGGTTGITNCRVLGGSTNAGQGSAAAGLLLSGGATVAARGDRCEIAAGANGTNSAIAGTGNLAIDPSVRLYSTNGAPLIEPSVTTRTLSLPALSLAGAPLGGTVTFDVQSAPNDNAIAVVARPGAPFAIPGLGDVWLDLTAGFAVLPVGTVGANGHLSGSIGVPTDPSLFGATFAWQFVTAGAQAPALTNPGAYLHD